MEEKSRCLSLELDLTGLRYRATDLTQAEVAELLSVTQGAVSQLEKRDDMLLSSLAAYVAVLGGELEVVARFADREDVRITQFDAV